MTARRAVGTITPSSNTIVERVTQAVTGLFPDVSAHFARIPFVGDKIHLSDRHDTKAMLAAAGLLADAKMDAIAWNGSKAAGIAFELDRDLCRRISAATGAPATTSVLALDEICRATGVRRIGLVTPFIEEYQEKLMGVLAREGLETLAEDHLGIADNYQIGLVDEATIAAQVRRVAAARPDAVLIVCTNYHGAPIVAALERELKVPVYDSVSAGVWKLLRLAGVDTRPAADRWGRLFAQEPGR